MHDTDECDVCGDETPLDGENGINHGGQVLCGDCWDKPVKFRVTCEARGWEMCDFEHEVQRNELNRYQVRQNAEMHANNHENEKRVFEDEIHETTVEEVPVSDG
ncbi:hypothetical protein [Halomarina oriensis]|uniref:hypothetical protein n=1 Tax=Halomarina oriensis TaxID=671145 RepID=UPI0013035666|nr:hypothetical protein [Halomarina oriensis]